MIQVRDTAIEGVKIIEPRVFRDERGYFFESYSHREFVEKVAPVDFVQDNESFSRYGVVRGLHFQKGDHAQSKLVQVMQGKVLDIVVDIRKGSPTYGRHVCMELSDENHLQVFIPAGLAHGFSVLSETAIFQYKCDRYYAPGSEGGISWDDPVLGIDWRIPKENVILSKGDDSRPGFKELAPFESAS